MAVLLPCCVTKKIKSAFPTLHLRTRSSTALNAPPPFFYETAMKIELEYERGGKGTKKGKKRKWLFGYPAH